MFFNEAGLGEGVFDMLKKLDSKYRNCIVCVNNPEMAISIAPVLYLNIRSEIGDNMKR